MGANGSPNVVVLVTVLLVIMALMKVLIKTTTMTTITTMTTTTTAMTTTMTTAIMLQAAFRRQALLPVDVSSHPNVPSPIWQPGPPRGRRAQAQLRRGAMGAKGCPGRGSLR